MSLILVQVSKKSIGDVKFMPALSLVLQPNPVYNAVGLDFFCGLVNIHVRYQLFSSTLKY